MVISIGICPDMKGTPIILHGGPKDPNNIASFNIKISPCKDSNKRTGAKCASTDEIKIYINELQIKVFSKEERVDWEMRDQIPKTKLFKSVF